MKTFPLILFGLGLALIPVCSRAADDGVQPLVREYLELTGLKMIAAVCEERALSAVKVDCPKLPASGMAEVVATFHRDQNLSVDVVGIYAGRQLPEDLRVVIDFYKTSAGQAIARKHADARLAAYRWNQEHPGEPVKNPIELLQASLTQSEKYVLADPSVEPAFGRLYAVEAEFRTIKMLDEIFRRQIDIARLTAKKSEAIHTRARENDECGTNRLWRRAAEDARRVAEAEAKAKADRRRRLYNQIGGGLLGLGVVALIVWKYRTVQPGADQ